MSFDELVGKEIGEYEIEELVGKGGLGAVFRARHLILDQVFALKMLLPEVSAKENLRQRFFREARKAAAVKHPNVVGVVNAGKHEDFIYLVMEYVDGTTLQDVLKMQGKLSPDEVATIAEQTLQGLKAAHDVGIIHRDIKPDNIMITDAGEVKIADFGLARDVDKRMEGLTVAGQVMGTPPYMSPEQWDGKELDARTDIYSMGIMLFQLLTGKLPFTGPSPLSIAKKVLTEVAPEVRDFEPGIDEALSGIVDKMMNRAIEERCASADEALDLIRRWHSGELQGSNSSGTKVIPKPPEKGADAGPVVSAVNTSGFDPTGAMPSSSSDVDIQAAPGISSGSYDPAGAAVAPPAPATPSGGSIPPPPPPPRRKGTSRGGVSTPPPPPPPMAPQVELPQVEAIELTPDDSEIANTGVPTPAEGAKVAAVTRDDMALLKLAESLKGPASVEDLIGAKIGRYQLLAKIEGSTRTQVFFAESPDGTHCVVKIIPFDALDKDAEQQRLLAFAESATSLSHPNIATTLEVGVDRRAYYAASVNTDGQSMKQYLRDLKRSPSVRETLVWIEQLLNALSHAHAAGALHLNIKPQNIIIAGDDRVQLVEWGLPRRWYAGDHHIFGTPLYMPLEQWRNMAPGPQADLYSLGVTWFQMLVGRTPFLGLKPVDLLKARLLNDCFQPNEMREDIPGSVNQMILRLMAREPEFRYQSADEALNNLFRIAGDMA